jgi:hypothetical protein
MNSIIMIEFLQEDRVCEGVEAGGRWTAGGDVEKMVYNYLELAGF